MHPYALYRYLQAVSSNGEFRIMYGSLKTLSSWPLPVDRLSWRQSPSARCSRKSPGLLKAMVEIIDAFHEALDMRLDAYKRYPFRGECKEHQEM